MSRAAGLLIGALLLGGAAREETPDVYLLAGQSNMSGRGELAELSEAERALDPCIRLYGNDGKWRIAAEPLDDAAGQVDAVAEDRQAGVGPGLFFARAMLKRRTRPILLVPCAKGGSSIGRWAPGGGRDTLYGACLARVREAGGRIAGVLWYQGESDTGSDEKAAAWKARFAALVASLRRDLAAPRLPVVFVQLADRATSPERAARYPAWATVQQAQAAVSLGCTHMVPAKGLTLNADELHLSTAGQRALGQRLAVAMEGLRKGGCG
ncbi:sialate O-acetylesterase [Sphingomonas sp.]|uniref:sialate O-acetylesterase n=1 Tax=Sphingomonas sp. TaxID=28214 RepID=UPI0031E2816D